MSIASIGVNSRLVARILAFGCVVAVLLTACGDTQPAPTEVPPTEEPPVAEAATPEQTSTPSPEPTASPTADPRSVERDALTALYESARGDGWTNNDNWISDSPIGEWHGVTVNEDGHVVGLALEENFLAGRLAPELADLANLTVLELGDNWLVGPIQPELGELSRLDKLTCRGIS